MAHTAVPKLIVVLAFAAVAVGCTNATPPPGSSSLLPPPASSVAPAKVASGENRIFAAPNPVSKGSRVGTTTIRWVAPGSPGAEARVSEDGGAEQVFARGGPAGSASASFIIAGRKYIFRLYSSPTSHKVLASVTVTQR